MNFKNSNFYRNGLHVKIAMHNGKAYELAERVYSCLQESCSKHVINHH